MFLHALLMNKPATASSMAVGRSALATATNTTTTYTIGLSGGAAVSGSVVVIFICQSTTPTLPIVTGGATWVAATGTTGNYACYYKVCGGSEPATYTVTFNGSGKSSNSAAVLLEITGPNATNPDDQQNNASSATPPTATSSAASDISIVGLVGANATAVYTAPAGYTMQQNTVAVSAQSIGVATLTNAGSGTITPGAFGGGGAGSPQKAWTILIKA